MVVTVVGAAFLASRGLDRAQQRADLLSMPSPSVSPTPNSDRSSGFPTSMSPEQVVNDRHARLQAAGVAPADPNTRVSLWSVTCTRPCPDSGRTEFDAIALTTDGYATTTYLSPTFPLGGDVQVTSPLNGVFLVSDQSDGHEMLVNAAGTVRAVTRVANQRRPTNPALWFQCAGSWRSNWCSLDPTTATAHKWPQAWQGSAASPAAVDRPWGANPQPRSTASSGHLEAWWDTDKGRRLQTLAAAHHGDYIANTPPGEMAYWARPDGAETVNLYTSNDHGETWQVDTRQAPGLNGYLQMKRSPEGAYLACSLYPRLEVWRAEAAGGPFEMVYRQVGRLGRETSGAGLWTQDRLIYATANSRTAISTDDGLTWTTIQTWR